MNDPSQSTARARVEARLERIAKELDSPAIREAIALLRKIQDDFPAPSPERS